MEWVGMVVVLTDLNGILLVNLEHLLMALLQHSLFELQHGYYVALYIHTHCHSLSMNMALFVCTCIEVLKSLVWGPTGIALAWHQYYNC